MKRYLHISILLLLTVSNSTLFSQGEVGIGTTTPAEKLDVNGAIIISGNAVMATPVPGTIKYNSATGYHDGYISAGSWKAIENYNEYLLNGDFTGLSCGTTSTVSIGSVSGTSTGAYETPFAGQYSDKKAQYLYLGSELLAGGLCEGNITEAAWNVISVGSPSAFNGFYIKMKLTTSTDLTGTSWETGVTTVYGPVNVSVIAGVNTFVLSTPFYWDGASNLLVEICYDNSASGTNTTIDWTTGLGYNGTRYALATTGAGCALSPATGLSTSRAVIFLTGNTAGAITGTEDYIYYEKGIVVGNPTIPAPYVHHGPGTITAEAIYDENLLLSDYVFDQYFDGELSESDEKKYGGYKQLSLPDMIAFMQKHRHLPTISGRTEWELNGTSSIGELATELWVTYETHALYIKEMHEKIASMESLINMAADPLVNAYQYEIELIRKDDQLSEIEKQEKINALLKLITEIQNKE